MEPFRWNLARREQLGKLLNSESPDVSQELVDAIAQCSRGRALQQSTTGIFRTLSAEPV
jgi:hypothetical protein